MKNKPLFKGVSRRHFVKVSGITALGFSSVGFAGCSFTGISIVQIPDDPASSSPIIAWAVNELVLAFRSKGIRVKNISRLPEGEGAGTCILVAGSGSGVASELLKGANVTIPELPEALGLVPAVNSGRQILLATGFDIRGLMYAVLELTDRVLYSAHPVEEMYFEGPLIEKPANRIRGINRLFVSEIEDKGWFNDREMWPEYLTMLATQRFNRFSLSLGIGYDFLQNVTDGYFLFSYPFLLAVPGYDVKVPQLPVEERDSNLEMLKYISGQTAARGLHFQLGLWMHGYEWLNSPNPNYTIEGLTPEIHAAYCRDAVRELLRQCPDISGITFRIHGESGVTEGSYDFWKTIFDGVATCGRKVEIDMHSKGMSPPMIETALSSGLDINISPKYWAEHLGLPYHQADIRSLEVPRSVSRGRGLMNLSSGSRSFTRYGYADLLNENRKYGVLHRIWPGTQRLLLWGDPLFSAAHSRAFSFCGSAGVDLMEPLSFKGRRGSGIAGDRCGYLDESLKPVWDWQKYLYSLRIFGRLAYNPDTDPDVWKRYLLSEFGQASGDVEQALANATRILPIVLTVHGASAGNNTYWPEMYTNMSMVDPQYTNPYSDSPSPKVFGNVSPMDPQLFISVNEFAGELVNRSRSGKYSPVEAAQWIEDYSDAAERYLESAVKRVQDIERPEFRRMKIDVVLMIGLGRFFAAKLRAGVLLGIYERSGNVAALETSLEYYRKARDIWDKFSMEAVSVYKKDITIGENPVIRGHWRDRLQAIDDDIAFMSELLVQAKDNQSEPEDNIKAAIEVAKGNPLRSAGSVGHTPPTKFTPGEEMILSLSTDTDPSSVVLHYRHVNHAERFITAVMSRGINGFKVSIPGEYTDSEYPLQYYFEFRSADGNAWLNPGFEITLDNQPYYVVRSI